jgi:large subunit ribosomal protein L27
MAHKKAGGSTQLGRDSQSKRLGIKIFQGAFAHAGNIIVRQRGTKYHPGRNMQQGGDDTLYSLISGFVHFTHKMVRKFDGRLKKTTFIHVLPEKKD